MKVFISYIVKDRHIGGKLKAALDEFGFDSFLAHEDIKPTQEWMNTILKHLKECDIVFVLLTNGIDKSVWCNQEIGVAIALKKMIIPIKVDQNPKGFLSKYQAMSLQKDGSLDFTKFNAIIAQNKKLGPSYRDLLIDALVESGNFFDAKKNAENIIEVDGFSTKQLERIINGYVKNDQIHNYSKARILISDFIKKNKKSINPFMYEAVRSKLS